jgi:hypothetical protein
MTVLLLAVLALAALPAVLAAVNLGALRTPPRATHAGLVSILIPARDEAPRIAATVAAALAAADGPVEVIVGDDHSADGTGAIVAGIAARDPRVRALAVPPLPPGWTGKVHACHRLGEAAQGEHLLFLDADVRLAPGAVGRLVAYAQARGLALVSAVPRQEMGTWGERLTVPMIGFLLVGYLPVPMMRRRRDPSLGAACGQLVLVARAPYQACGGHGAIRALLHDGVQLARLLRRSGARTDLVAGHRLATCRMYASLPEAWAGFLKNAHEGMATPRALPVWTVLLAGGHVLPPLLVLGGAGSLALAALALSLGTRLAITLAAREPLLTVPLHPAAVAVALAIQWQALVRRRRGGAAAWKGRSYAPDGPDVAAAPPVGEGKGAG